MEREADSFCFLHQGHERRDAGRQPHSGVVGWKMCPMFLHTRPRCQFYIFDIKMCAKGCEWVLWRQRCSIQRHSAQNLCYARLAMGHSSHFYLRKNPSVWCRPQKNTLMSLMRRRTSQLRRDNKVLQTLSATRYFQCRSFWSSMFFNQRDVHISTEI